MQVSPVGFRCYRGLTTPRQPESLGQPSPTFGGLPDRLKRPWLLSLLVPFILLPATLSGLITKKSPSLLSTQNIAAVKPVTQPETESTIQERAAINAGGPNPSPSSQMPSAMAHSPDEQSGSLPIFRDMATAMEDKFLREVERLRQEGYFDRITPKAVEACLRLIQATRRNLEVPLSQLMTTIKKPGGSAMAILDNNGFVPDKDNAPLSQTPYGLFLEDTQYLDRFAIQSSKGGVLQVNNAQVKPESVKYRYSMDNYPLHIVREDKVGDRNLVQRMKFVNNGSQTKEFTLVYDSHANDLFAARGIKKPPGLNIVYDPIRLLDREALLTAHVSRVEDKTPITALSQPLEQWAEAEKKAPNTIRTRIRLTEKNSEQVRFEVPPGSNGTSVALKVTLPPGSSEMITLQIQPENLLRETQEKPFGGLNKALQDECMTKVEVLPEKGFEHLEKVWKTGKSDIEQLLIPIPCGNETYFIASAGSPRFIAPFGRDSEITAEQMLKFNPDLARDTLKVLAHYQGKEFNAFREEEEGKILHELRLGEWSRLGFSPHSPYYGTIDATPLFVILLRDYIAQTNDSQTMQALWPNMEKALDWIDRHVNDPASPLQGFLAQRLLKSDNAVGAKGLKNVGWKDSGDSMQHVLDSDGKLQDPEYPLALAEVQAYVYGAWNAAAELYQRMAQIMRDNSPMKETLLEKSSRYAQQAEELKVRFNNRFWMEESQFIATALQGNGQQLKSISSNGAQCLWTGIVDKDKAFRMAQRLRQPDMLSGWGIRTLSAKEKAFFPFSYHNGSVWPHDNSLIVAGLKRYGFGDEALEVANQIFDASRTFGPDHRLPELYVGFQREGENEIPPPYPETCIPQAWASGTPFLLLSSLLGMEINMAEKQITLNQPLLPQGVEVLHLRGVKISPSETVDLRIQKRSGQITPQVSLIGGTCKDATLVVKDEKGIEHRIVPVQKAS